MFLTSSGYRKLTLTVAEYLGLWSHTQTSLRQSGHETSEHVQPNASLVQPNASLIPRPSIIDNMMESLVNFVCRMTSGGRMVDVGRLEAW